MDVDIDGRGVGFDEDDEQGMAGRFDEASIRFFEGVRDGFVFDRPAVEEDVLMACGRSCDRGLSGQAPDGDVFFV